MALLTVLSAAARADSIRATARSGDLIRLVHLRREGGELFVPLLACGPLLDARASWDRGTNRWRIEGGGATAEGFLDEPLLLVRGHPLLVRTPPRLSGGDPYLSLEALQRLGRIGWNADVLWNEGARELTVQPATAEAAEPAAAPSRAAPAPLPPPAPGVRVVALDPGHARRAGVRGRGVTEGDVGLGLAAAVGATLADPWIDARVLRGPDDDLDPRDVASLANALPADLVVGFHASEHGEPGVAVWTWAMSNVLGTGITFEPFEPGTGWARQAAAHAARSGVLAGRIAAAAGAAGLPVHGPFGAPLAVLEGFACPAAIVELRALGAPEGAAVATDPDRVAALAAAVATAIRDVLGPPPVPPPAAPAP